MQKVLRFLPLLLLLTLPAGAQAQLLFTTNNGAITITGYSGGPTVIVIPSATNGYPVTSIGSFAFGSCIRLTSVTMPNSVTIAKLQDQIGAQSPTSTKFDLCNPLQTLAAKVLTVADDDCQFTKHYHDYVCGG